jgi:hypothetical protein
LLTKVWPPTYRTRVHITTTADWTTVDLVSGAAILRPDRLVASPGAHADLEHLNRFVLNQPLANAIAGTSVETAYDVYLDSVKGSQDIVFAIERGNIGSTRFTVYNHVGPGAVPVMSVTWDGIIAGGTNRKTVRVPAAGLMVPL